MINNLTLEMREGFRRVNAEIAGIKSDINAINVRLDKHEERMNKHWGIQ